jgi:GTP-dependent phosphoenolpyruvate carboxykinase
VQAQFCAHSVIDYGLLRKVRDTKRGKKKKPKIFVVRFFVKKVKSSIVNCGEPKSDYRAVI